MSLFRKYFFIWIYYKDGKGMEGYKTTLCDYNPLTSSKSNVISVTTGRMIKEIENKNSNHVVITDIKIF